jgi:hypothetical protein
VNLFDAPLGCERLRAQWVAGGHGDQPAVEHSCRIDDSVIGDAGGAENADLAAPSAGHRYRGASRRALDNGFINPHVSQAVRHARANDGDPNGTSHDDRPPDATSHQPGLRIVGS